MSIRSVFIISSLISCSYLQLDVLEIAVQNTFQWFGGDMNEMSAVRLEILTIKVPFSIYFSLWWYQYTSRVARHFFFVDSFWSIFLMVFCTSSSFFLGTMSWSLDLSISNLFYFMKNIFGFLLDIYHANVIKPCAAPSITCFVGFHTLSFTL